MAHRDQTLLLPVAREEALAEAGLQVVPRNLPADPVAVGLQVVPRNLPADPVAAGFAPVRVDYPGERHTCHKNDPLVAQVRRSASRCS